MLKRKFFLIIFILIIGFNFLITGNLVNDQLINNLQKIFVKSVQANDNLFPRIVILDPDSPFSPVLTQIDNHKVPVGLNSPWEMPYDMKYYARNVEKRDAPLASIPITYQKNTFKSILNRHFPLTIFAQTACPMFYLGDTNCDNTINFKDLIFLLSKYYTPENMADINSDKIVNTIDFSISKKNQNTPLVSNDDFDNARVISRLPYDDIISKNYTYTIASDDPNLSCNLNTQGSDSVWYKYTPTTNQKVDFSAHPVANSAANWAEINIFTGSRGNLSELFCYEFAGLNSDNYYEYDLLAGTTYYFEYTSIYPQVVGDFYISITPSGDFLPQDPWTGEYWNAPTGDNPQIPPTSPNLIKNNESKLDFNWSNSSPGQDINVEHFVARWNSIQNFPKNGAYKFIAWLDDGIKLYIDNKLILDHWKNIRYDGIKYNQGNYTDVDSPTNVPYRITANGIITAGNHNVRVEYYQNKKPDAQIRLNWYLIPALPKTTVQATLAEDAAFTKNVLNISNFVNNLGNTSGCWTLNPQQGASCIQTAIWYTFSDFNLKNNSLYVRYTASDGTIMDFNTAVDFVWPDINKVPTDGYQGMIYPRPTDVPLASPIPSGMSLTHEWLTNNLYDTRYAKIYNCYHEDYGHQRIWKGSLKPGESMMIPMPFCDNLTSIGPGGANLFAQFYGKGDKLTLKTISPSGITYEGHKVLSDTQTGYTKWQRCNILPGVWNSVGAGASGNIEPGIWKVVLSNESNTIANEVVVKTTAFMSEDNYHFIMQNYCPDEDLALIYPW